LASRCMTHIPIHRIKSLWARRRGRVAESRHELDEVLTDTA
jgi:hypothetical protein